MCFFHVCFLLLWKMLVLIHLWFMSKAYHQLCCAHTFALPVHLCICIFYYVLRVMCVKGIFGEISYISKNCIFDTYDIILRLQLMRWLWVPGDYVLFNITIFYVSSLCLQNMKLAPQSISGRCINLLTSLFIDDVWASSI